MSNYFPAGCSFTFDTGYNFDSRGPVACEVKLFSDDPYGSPNAHGSPRNNFDTPPQWTCGHTNASACTAGSSDGITTICQSNGFWNGERIFTDPPVGPPYEQGSSVNAYRCCDQGRGLCAPTMLSRGITNPQGQFPMARKPVRSYHNGIFSSQNYNSLPRGWYIWLRYCPLFSTVSSYTYDRFLYKYTTILFPGSAGACSFDGRQNTTYSFYAVNEQPNPFWAAMPYYGCLVPSPFRFAGYLGDYFRIDMLVTNGFLQSNGFSNPRRIFEGDCAPCF
jgi:hypothetical protein